MKKRGKIADKDTDDADDIKIGKNITISVKPPLRRYLEKKMRKRNAPISGVTPTGIVNEMLAARIKNDENCESCDD